MKKLYIKVKDGSLLQIDEKFVRINVKGGRILRVSSNRDGGALAKDSYDLNIERRPKFRYGPHGVTQASSSDDTSAPPKGNYSIASAKSAVAAQQDAQNLIKAVGRDVSEAEANFYKRFSFEK